MKQSSRNPPGTETCNYRCKFYHPLYCTTLGHKSATHKSCFMANKSKQEREEAEKEIIRLSVEEHLENAEQTRKYKLVYFAYMIEFLQQKIKEKLKLLFVLRNNIYLANQTNERRTISLRNGYKNIS